MSAIVGTSRVLITPTEDIDIEALSHDPTPIPPSFRRVRVNANLPLLATIKVTVTMMYMMNKMDKNLVNGVLFYTVNITMTFLYGEFFKTNYSSRTVSYFLSEHIIL